MFERNHSNIYVGDYFMPSVRFHRDHLCFYVLQHFYPFPGPPCLPFVFCIGSSWRACCVLYLEDFSINRTFKFTLLHSLRSSYCKISNYCEQKRTFFSFGLSANIPKASTMEKRGNLCQNMVAFFRLNVLKKHTHQNWGRQQRNIFQWLFIMSYVSFRLNCYYSSLMLLGACIIYSIGSCGAMK